jgi:ABC-2 type transport system ATP-binding protein
MTHPAIAVTGLRKSYGDKLVLDGVDLTVMEGSVFALLGPNGAGKTTTVQILSTLIPCDAGHIRIAGHDPARDPDAVRDVIGVTGQFSAVDNLLTGEENLRLMADLRHLDNRTGRERAARLLRQFDLADSSRKPVSTYSGGMRRRLDLCASLVGRPPVVLLDEPTTGLDPRSKLDVQTFIEEIRKTHDASIVLTTHDLDEAERLSDEIVVLNDGRIVAAGSPEVLKRLVAERFDQAPTMHNVFMTYTGRSLDEDVEEEADDE